MCVVDKETARDGHKIAKSRKIHIFVFYIMNLEPIEIWTCSTPQNDSLNFSFVKDIKVNGQKNPN